MVTAGVPYMHRIQEGVAVIAETFNIRRLCFGDLHLDHIRSWREAELSSLGALHFPIWHVPYETLLADLEASKV
jgi:ATP-binding cassette subfamily B (MDR/TAP) protein 1